LEATLWLVHGLFLSLFCKLLAPRRTKSEPVGSLPRFDKPGMPRYRCYFTKRACSLYLQRVNARLVETKRTSTSTRTCSR
jgi:hypothetical protein